MTMAFGERARSGKLIEVFLWGSPPQFSLIAFIGASIFLQSICARAQETNHPNRFSIGVQSGLSSNDGEKLFLQNQLYAHWHLPADWPLGSRWHLQPRLELTAGFLLNSEDGFIGSLGPSVILKYEDLPVGLGVGISPTFLSRDKFEGKQLGFPLEFTSHIRLEWAIHQHWELSYQF